MKIVRSILDYSFHASWFFGFLFAFIFSLLSLFILDDYLESYMPSDSTIIIVCSLITFLATTVVRLSYFAKNEAGQFILLSVGLLFLTTLVGVGFGYWSRITEDISLHDRSLIVLGGSFSSSFLSMFIFMFTQLLIDTRKEKALENKSSSSD